MRKLPGGYRAPSLKRTSCCDNFSSSSVVSCTFSALCVCLKFGHHPHPLSYLCAKFCFFCSLHCWTNPWRKIRYSINHSITHSPSLFDARGTEAFASEQWLPFSHFGQNQPQNFVHSSHSIRWSSYKFSWKLLENFAPSCSQTNRQMDTDESNNSLPEITTIIITITNKK